MRRASSEARGRTIAARQARKRIAVGMALFLSVALLAEMHCFAPLFYAILARGSCLAMRCPLPCVIALGKLAADLLGFAWHELPPIFANCLEPCKMLAN